MIRLEKIKHLYNLVMENKWMKILGYASIKVLILKDQISTARKITNRATEENNFEERAPSLQSHCEQYY